MRERSTSPRIHKKCHRRVRSDPVRTDKLHIVPGHRSSIQQTQPLLHLRTPDLEEMAMLALHRRETSPGRWKEHESSTATMLHKRSYSPMSPVADAQETQVC
jgi:hypothetical protein